MSYESQMALRSLNHKLCRLGMSERLIFDFIRTL